ncbi:flagellar motor protein MotB [Niastella caeni]|uniref:Flagellar motor protein MotB n=1 Tax=Niastella caeni TaxID=2569763 RepID=A0A4S8HXI4_9BACT|nr:OmpA family protein [Niastella caeni]THU40433.1 flagellar motor protein MotB [Niastella caeni]
MKKLLATGIIGCSMLAANAQFTYDYLRAADNYYKKADYYSAAQYYEKYLGTASQKIKTTEYSPYTVPNSAKKKDVPVSSRQLAVYRVAESYRLLHDHAKAATYYGQAVDANSGEFPLARYYYALELRALANYEQSEKEFNRFLDEHRSDDQYGESAKKELMSLRFIQTQLKKKDLKLYSVQKAGTPLNTEGANYAPVWLNENTLLFTSTRVDSTSGRNQSHINRVYTTPVTDGLTGEVKLLPLPQANAMHQGVVSLTPDGNTLFLTRWMIVGGKKVSGIYSSRKNGNGWSEPVLLDSFINATGFSAQQPFVMPGGNYLLYASDKNGGYGGFDLWYAELDESGKPVRTANLGDVINTAYDEQAPYYHAPSSSLVFSGNGRVGMGGYDFFYSKGSMDAWAAPVNFGYPVNSVKDDIYFVSKGGVKNVLEDVWLSSDREATCCLELFYLKKVIPKKQVSGQVVSCEDKLPLSGVAIKIIDTIQNKVVYTQTTAVDGNYSFTLDEFQPLKAVASVSGYSDGSLPFYAPLDEEAEQLTNPAICLVKDVPPVDEVIVLDNVYYDFDKATLKKESHASLDKLVAMMTAHPEVVIELSAHTDNKGNDAYNQRLSEARAQACVAYLISKGIDKDRLQAKGYGSTQPIAPNSNDDGSDNPEGRQQNRRTEFKVLGK